MGIPKDPTKRKQWIDQIRSYHRSDETRLSERYGYNYTEYQKIILDFTQGGIADG